MVVAIVGLSVIIQFSESNEVFAQSAYNIKKDGGGNYMALHASNNSTYYTSNAMATTWNYVITNGGSTLTFNLLNSTYNVNSSLNTKNGLTVNGNDATLYVASSIYVVQATTSTNQNLTFNDLIFDFQNTGWQVFIPGSNASPAQNITFDNVDFINIGSVWGMEINFSYPDPSLPSSKNTNIVLRDCLVTSPAGSGTLENIIIENAENVTVEGCIFENTASSKPASLALYGGVIDAEIKNNLFIDNPGGDLYISQSSDVDIHNNVFSDRIRVFDSRNIVIHSNLIQWIEIADFDEAQYDLHTSFYRGSRDIAITENAFNTGGSIGYAIELDTTLNTQNMPKDILISRNDFNTLRGLFLGQNMPASSDYVQGLKITGNNVIKNDAFLGSDVMIISGRSGNTNNGYSDVYIQGNRISTSPAGSPPWDVNIGTGFASVYITYNDFGNNGISNTAGYTIIGNY